MAMSLEMPVILTGPWFQFVVFAAAFFSAWPLMRRRNNTRWAYLVAASFFFYGWWDWRFLFLIIGSGLIDYCAALGMSRWPRWRKVFLIASIFGNVGSLAVFKYLDFLIGNFNWLSGFLGGGWRLPMAELILPVGISFYTFQSMSYTFDVYRRRMKPTHNILHFFAYLSMFPQLVAGPIVRAACLLPQLEKNHTTTEAERWEGTKLILMGLFKKMVVADNIAPAVDAAFSATVPAASTGYWWVVMVLFAYQIYCDFSGYSNIARGLGRWMGYDFPVYFNHPYIAGSFRDFGFLERTIAAPAVRWMIGPDTMLTWEAEFHDHDCRGDRGFPAIRGNALVLPRSRYVGEPANDFLHTVDYWQTLVLTHRLNDCWQIEIGGSSLFDDMKGSQTYATGHVAGPQYARGRSDIQPMHEQAHSLIANLAGEFSTGAFQHKPLVGLEYTYFDSDSLFLLDPTYPVLDVFNPIYLNPPAVFTPFSVFRFPAFRQQGMLVDADRHEVRTDGIYLFEVGERTKRWRERIERENPTAVELVEGSWAFHWPER